MPLLPGARLGSYEIVASLGAGGMGEVYRARDSRLGREVAVKVLPESVASHPDRLARFEREAKAVAALNHPNIVTIFSIEEAAGTRFLTMELVEGHGLDLLITPGGLVLSRVLDLAIPLADALVAAHERGVVHRDLKPANVMVTSTGRLKVLDFGLAKLTSMEPTSDATLARTVEAPVSSAGQVVGTAPYMAPEQLRGEPVDARTDLFAFGILIYELASGRRPFIGTTLADVTSAILRDAPPPLQLLRADLPGDLHRIVGRCLEKDRERRFQTAKDVRNELEFLRRTIESSGMAAAAAAASTSTTSATSATSTVSTASATSQYSPPPGTAPTPPPAPAPGPPPHEIPSNAVLPFVNRSRDADDEYFSDGLADELLNVLAKIRGLRVAARTSSYHFKGKDEELSTIGRKLNVATLLEGSVRKSGNRVRISVQLVKVSDGYHLWSETYDRTLDDIFAVQDDIAQSVVKELRTTLMGEAPHSKASGEVRAAVEAAAKGRAENPEAHRLVLQGRYFVERFTRDDVARAVGYFRQALELDPDSALAWVELGRAINHQAGYGWIPLRAGAEEARAATQRGIALQPDLSEAYVVLGSIQVSHDWDWKAAEASFLRALELDPSGAYALRAIGGLALGVGRLDDAIALAQRATEHDPLNSGAFSTLGNAYRYAGRYDEARQALVKALELNPQRIVTHLVLGLILAEQGRDAEAIRELEQEPEPFARLCGLSIAHHLAGRAEQSDAALQALIDGHAEDAAYQIAGACAMRREWDAAFEWLDRAYSQRDVGLALLRFEPVFRPVQSDPRWAAFMKKMGFIDA